MSATRLSIRPSTGTLNEGGERLLPEMFKHKVLELSENTLSSLQDIWKEAGYENIECQRLLADIYGKIQATCNAELEAEQQILEHAKQEVATKSSEYTDFCDRLGRPTDIDYILEMNFTDKLAELEKLINTITEEVQGREKLMDDEFANINLLVDSLGESFPSMDLFQGPDGTPKLSDIRLNLMKEYAEELESIKAQRTKDILGLVEECHKHMADMMIAEEGFKTMNDSEEYYELDKKIDDYTKMGKFSFSLHKKDINRLTRRLKSFSEEKERRRTELATMGTEIARLWTLLRVPSEEREVFQASFKMNLSMETLSKGMDELERLKEVRTKSLSKVISVIRDDISVLWDEAGIESEECRREEFPLFFADMDSIEDSAVEEHEAYFGTMRKRVEELRPLLQRISRRETVILERLELEKLQQNSARLADRSTKGRENRKNEEAMSARVKTLPKINKDITAQILAWEETHGAFVYAGERYVERMVHQEEEYIEIRDSFRNARKKKDGKMDPPAGSTSNSTLRSTLTSTSKKTSTTRGLHSTTKQNLLHSSASHGLPVPPQHDSNQRAYNENMPPPSATPNNRNAKNTLNGSNINNKDSKRHEQTESGIVKDSRDSDGSQYTSMTEVKERPTSTGSSTVVRPVGGDRD